MLDFFQILPKKNYFHFFLASFLQGLNSLCMNSAKWICFSFARNIDYTFYYKKYLNFFCTYFCSGVISAFKIFAAAIAGFAYENCTSACKINGK